VPEHYVAGMRQVLIQPQPGQAPTQWAGERRLAGLERSPPQVLAVLLQQVEDKPLPACPATTQVENTAVARAWHEDVINRRNPAMLIGTNGKVACAAGRIVLAVLFPYS
jgi:hypothetical protein